MSLEDGAEDVPNNIIFIVINSLACCQTSPNEARKFIQEMSSTEEGQTRL